MDTFGQTIVTKDFESDLIDVIPGQREVVAIISTEAVDRVGEVVITKGLISKNYTGTPVFLNHDKNMPIGKDLWVKKDAGRTIAKIKYSDATDTARDMWSLVQDGVMKTYSIGFRELDTGLPTESEKSLYGNGVKRIIRAWELLENSLVGIPCNPEAVQIAVSKGMQLSPMTLKMFGVDEVVKAHTPVTVNESGVAHAMALIRAGHINRDGSWDFTSEDGNKLIGSGNDWASYASAHIATDPAATDNTKARWKYPVLKDGMVWLHGLRAAESRASAQGETEIAAAAKRLFDAASTHKTMGQYAVKIAEAFARKMA